MLGKSPQSPRNLQDLWSSRKFFFYSSLTYITECRALRECSWSWTNSGVNKDFIFRFHFFLLLQQKEESMELAHSYVEKTMMSLSLRICLFWGLSRNGSIFRDSGPSLPARFHEKQKILMPVSFFQGLRLFESHLNWVLISFLLN